MRVLVTGGHFSPAYSVIKELINGGHTVAIAGRKASFEGENTESLEYSVAKKEKVKFYEVRTGRFQRKFTKHTVPSVFKTFRGVSDSLKIISEFNPDVVMTFGGYLAAPVAFAASLKKVPIVLHEQTQAAGIASKFVSRFAKKVCVSFETSLKYFPNKKVVFTGIPIREEISMVDKKIVESIEKPVIYVTGGSTGAHFINELVGNSLNELLRSFSIIHQTGESAVFNDYDYLTQKRSKLTEPKQERYILRKYIYPNEIGHAFELADLVVSRSGINTTVEILALGKTCLLIPLSHGQKNEQLDNAKFLSKVGIGEYMEEKDATPESFVAKIKEIFQAKKEYEKNQEKTSDYIVRDAAKRIVSVIEEVYGKKSS